MLFRKDIDPSCAYCAKGSVISDCEVACAKRGVVPISFHCRSFRYDPLKRVPTRPTSLQTGNWKEEDFSL